ncbi:MAG TPA: sigma-54 dependent transcriptional regulator [Polyangiaceae bacterium]
MKNSILVIEDDPLIRNNVVELFTEEGFCVAAAENGADGVALAKGRRPDVIVCDIMLPGLDGHGVLRAVREHPPTSSLPFIFLTAKAERADIRAGMNLGADDYITKPFTLPELLDAVRSRLRRMDELVERARDAVAVESAAVRDATPPAYEPGDGVVVLDPVMKNVYEQAARAAGAMINVLILGETGVGKEILARAVHNLSPRANGPFIALNCGALTESLLEAELFGHEKGAFTGALQARAGLFEAAQGGTLFLDEIGEASPAIQARLLRALEDRKVLRVGARAEREVDVRFISATNRDPEAEVARGTFRQDLYYRLNGISFTIPPLRERKSEIAALSRMFLARARVENNITRPLALSEGVLELFHAYPWPGNVRELKKAIEHGAVLCDGELILLEHLPSKLLSGGARTPASRPPPASAGVPAASAPPFPPSAPPFPPSAPPDPAYEDPLSRVQRELANAERKRVQEALDACAGNQTRAAELLGISRRTLVSRLTEYNLPRPRKR